MIENGYTPVFGPNLESEFEFLTPEPEAAPTPETVLAPEPEEPAAPVEVVTVEDLLDFLAGTGQEETEEPPEEPVEEEISELPEEPVSEALPSGGQSVQIVGMDTVLYRLEAIQGVTDHPALTTPFEDYTVTEGLLLLLFLSVFVMACVRMLKGGFSWLR